MRQKTIDHDGLDGLDGFYGPEIFNVLMRSGTIDHDGNDGHDGHEFFFQCPYDNLPNSCTGLMAQGSWLRAHGSELIARKD